MRGETETETTRLKTFHCNPPPLAESGIVFLLSTVNFALPISHVRFGLMCRELGDDVLANAQFSCGQIRILCERFPGDEQMGPGGSK